MKKLLALILAAVYLLSLTACQTETETKYLQTSVTQEYMGTVTLKTEIQYDSNGTQTANIQYTNGEETSRSEYSYTDNSVIIHITQDGESGTMKQVYEKDAAGNIIRAEMYVDEELYSVTDCTYDSRGNRLTNVQNTIAVGMTYTTTYTYDENDNPIRIVNDYSSGAGSVTENTYDEKGRLSLSMIYDLEGTLTSKEEHKWTTETSEVVETYDAAGNLTSTAANTYDGHGNKLTSETYDNAGKLTLRITYTYEKFEVPVK